MTRASPFLPAAVAALALSLVLVALPHAEGLLRALFPEVERPLYARARWGDLLLAHLSLVLLSSGAAALVGIGLGVAVTRGRGRALRGLVERVAAAGQAVPPVAVLALAVPSLGYGAAPTWLALLLYGLLPVLSATLAGLAAVPRAAVDAARGLGFSAAGRLLRVELPLASRVILSGVRVSTTVNVGTAALGATVGASSLGSPIIEGLAAGNAAHVAQGALVVGLLALLIDRLFGALRQALPATRPGADAPAGA